MNLSRKNKTQLGASLSHLVKIYNCGDTLDPRHQDFILDICKDIKAYQRLSNVKGIQIIVKNYKMGSRSVKMLHFAYGNKTIPIPKNKVINALFPKKTKTKPNPVTRVRAALRKVIDRQIQDFRETVSFPCVCVLTGNTLVHWGQIHVDHNPTFVSLVEGWLIENDLYYDEIKIIGGKNNPRLSNKELEQSWYDYHLENANLRVTFKKANMSRGADGFKGTNRISR